MICPLCTADDDRVIDSRPSDNGDSIRRRRECNACGRRFTTYERAEKTARLMVVKRSGARVSFDAQSILRGVMAACGKRAIPEDTKVAIVQEIDDELHREFDREVTSAEIGERVANRLRQLDPVVYIRFASEYYGYQTAEEFAQALDEIRSRPPEFKHQGVLFQNPRQRPELRPTPNGPARG